MSCVTRFRVLRGTTAQRTAFTPLTGELVWDTTLSQMFVGDGATAGGLPLSATTDLTQVVRNTTGATIAKGKVVYISGASGGYPEVTLASNASEALSTRTIGITIEEIANNTTGIVLLSGVVTGLDTSAYSEGDTLWLSTSGDIQNTTPVTPAHAVFVGYVLTVSPVSGTILLKIQNGYELGELHDVLIGSPANGDLISYDSALGYWKNIAPATVATSGDHADLSNIGTNTHAQIDSHIANTSNPHSVTASQVGAYTTSEADSAVSGAITTHTGLADPHSQYLLESAASTVATSGDHGDLSGLSDDDHSQYALLAGRLGGQVLTGGTASGDDLTLNSTSNATKGGVFIQPSGGLVSVGNSSPEAKLHVTADGSNNNKQIIIDQGGAGDAAASFRLPGTQEWVVGIDNSDSDKFKINSGSSLGSNDALTLTTANYLGVNNSAPSGPLHIKHSGASAVTEAWIEDTANPNIALRLKHATCINNGFDFTVDSTLSVNMNLRENGTIKFSTNNTEQMRLSNSGKFGVGTNSPSNKLHVSSTDATPLRVTRTSSSSNCNMAFENDAATAYVGSIGSSFGIGPNANLVTNPWIYINNSNVGIGPTSPSAKLHVDGPVRFGQYTVAGVPSASSSGAGSMIYVSNESGGAVMAFSDGTNWRRVTDRAVIS